MDCFKIASPSSIIKDKAQHKKFEIKDIQQQEHRENQGGKGVYNINDGQSTLHVDSATN